MVATIDRRTVLAGAVAASLVVRRTVAAADQKPRATEPMLDIHVHLFGIGDNASGCRLSKTITEAPTFGFLLKALRVRERAKTVDEGYVVALAEQLRGSGLQKAVVLAQDAVYDRAGKPDWTRTHFYVPNDYLFQTTAKYPDRMAPCVSINPDRADALAELDRCADKGARMLKIHPPIQGVDLARKEHRKFFQRCAARRMVVMVHTGHEHSAPIVDVALASPRKLELALDEGCTVVACHCGTGRTADRPDMLPDFLTMAHKYPNLWGDTSVLGGMGRADDFLRLLADKPIHGRLLHGSDFPFPPVPMAFAEKIGLAEALRLQAMPNLIGQDLALKEALGIGRASAERAYNLIAQAAGLDKQPIEKTRGRQEHRP
jgi:predicted TIM-barrel fold metal-dependent hydrolase